MRYFSAGLIVMGLAIMGGAESHDYMPMLLAQGLLGMMSFGAGAALAMEES